jgi:hypothetical protein
MRTLTLRTAAAGAVLPLALVSLAACGDNSSSGTATDPAASASSTDSGATTPTEGQTVDPADFLEQVKGAATKITTAKFDLKMDASGEAITATGAMDMTGDKPAVQMSMTIPGESGAMEMRMFGSVLYFQIPGQDGKFVKMDLSDPNGPLGSLGGTLDNLDPQAMMSQISPDAFKKVTYVGTEDIAGQQLKHYAIVLDSAAATSMLGNLPSSATSSLPKTLAYDMYLDSEGRMSQFKMAMPKLMTMTMTYSGFGDNVDIQAPDPSDITEMPGLPGASASS